MLPFHPFFCKFLHKTYLAASAVFPSLLSFLNLLVFLTSPPFLPLPLHCILFFYGTNIFINHCPVTLIINHIFSYVFLALCCWPLSRQDIYYPCLYIITTMAIASQLFRLIWLARVPEGLYLHHCHRCGRVYQLVYSTCQFILTVGNYTNQSFSCSYGRKPRCIT